MKHIYTISIVALLAFSSTAFSQKVELKSATELGNNPPLCTTFSNDGTELYVSSDSKRIITVNVSDGRMNGTKEVSKKIVKMDYSPDGKYFGYLGSDLRLYINNAETNAQLSKSKKSNIQAFTFVGETKECVVSHFKPIDIMVYDNNTQTTIHRFNNYRSWTFVNSSSDGKYLIMGDIYDVYIYDYASKENVVANIKKPADPRESWQKVEFTPDNTMLVALVGINSNYPSIEFYDPETEKKIFTHQVYNDKNKKGYIDFSISPDGKTLAVSHYRDNIVRMWDISSIYPLTAGHGAIVEKKEEPKEPIKVEKTSAEMEQAKLDALMAKIDALSAAPAATPTPIEKEVCKEVDLNIPVTETKHPFRFALIIGNEDYSSFQNGLESEVNVDYAINDAKVFKEYMIKTLGTPEENITYLENATAGQMNQAISKFNKIIEFSEGEAEIFFYYSGHGLPDENTKESYVMPVDVSGFTLQYAIKVNDIYAKLTQHPSKRVTVFMDACFSGGARNAGLVAVKGVKITPKKDVLKGNMIIFTSSTGDESSQVYKDKYHGMFTYHLLKKLKETNGDVTYGELSDYLNKNVKLRSVVTNNKTQTPTTNVSTNIVDSWSTWKIK